MSIYVQLIKLILFQRLFRSLLPSLPLDVLNDYYDIINTKNY
jgi:hypothetical protein